MSKNDIVSTIVTAERFEEYIVDVMKIGRDIWCEMDKALALTVKTAKITHGIEFKVQRKVTNLIILPFMCTWL